MTASGRAAPLIVLLMGVSGAGKSTVGRALAEMTGWPFRDADGFHPPANIAKMSRGEPLGDADRGPWLDAIAAWIAECRDAGAPAIVSCSALKRRYRDRLIGRNADVALVYLRGGRDLIGSRLKARTGHFMPATLLESQFSALEEPSADEHALVVDVAFTPEAIARRIVTTLHFPAPR